MVAVVMVVLLFGWPSEGAARSEGPTAKELDAMTIDELDRELLALECELAVVQRERFVLAMASEDVRGAGLALAAWRSHQRMAWTLAADGFGDPVLSARVALHARALAIEGRIPARLEEDAGALGRELEELTRALA